MVLQSIKDSSMVANEVFIKRSCLVSEGFLFFSLYSFFCIAKHWMTSENILTIVFV